MISVFFIPTYAAPLVCGSQSGGIAEPVGECVSAVFPSVMEALFLIVSMLALPIQANWKLFVGYADALVSNSRHMKAIKKGADRMRKHATELTQHAVVAVVLHYSADMLPSL